jgi:hypothetical protein
MTIDRKRSLLEALAQTSTDEFDKALIEAYAENFSYEDLEQTFREQMIQEVSRENEA